MKKIIEFETMYGSGKIEYIKRDETGRNDTFDVIVEETYLWYTEEHVISDVEKNIYKYI